MADYPIMLRIAGRSCVVVGGGAVAGRKVAGLLAAEAAVTVISPALGADLEALAEESKITYQPTVYTPGLLADLRPMLVFAATDNSAVNQQVTDEARSLGALVDLADSGAEGDFINPAVVRRGAITISISTGGGSPALAAHLRQKVEAAVGAEYATLAAWLAAIRADVRDNIDSQAARADLWTRIIESSILDDLRRGEVEAARLTFDQLVANSENN